jgi:hypothetical protein
MLPAVQWFTGPALVFLCMMGFLIIFFLEGFLIKDLLLGVLVAVFLIINYVTFWSFDATISPFSILFRLSLVFFPLILSYYYWREDRHVHLKLLLTVGLGALTVTAVTTVVGLMQFPEASRIMATGTEYERYYPMNIGGYGFIYTLVIAFPLVYYLGLNKRNLLFSLAIPIFMLCVFKSQYVYALLLTVFIIAVIVAFAMAGPILRIGQLSFVFAISTAAVLSYLVLAAPVAEILDYFAMEVDSIYITLRLQQVADFLRHGTLTGDLGMRINLYVASIDAFLDNPLIGTWGDRYALYQPGGHSFFLDVLGSSGLVGILFLGGILYNFYSDIIASLTVLPCYPYIFWALLQFAIVATINTINTSPTIGMTVFFLVPAVAAFEPGNGEGNVAPS